MDKIIIDLALLNKLGLTINEYLSLYDISNDLSISSIFNYGITELVSLEKKGFIKLLDSEIMLREKAKKLFGEEEDLFNEWINLYPTMVKKSGGGTRSLSPASSNTILGERLRKKWNLIFKKDVEAQRFAIKVLQAEIKDRTKSGDLEYMVESYRWLNEGFHEKNSHLIKKDNDNSIDYSQEDWL